MSVIVEVMVAAHADSRGKNKKHATNKRDMIT